MNRLFMKFYEKAYGRVVMPPLFTRAHAVGGEQKPLKDALNYLDRHPAFAEMVYRLAFDPFPVTVGGVRLPHPAILGAGVLKGRGFPNERDSCAALYREHSRFIPGARQLSTMLGAVEIGSFTYLPRIGKVNALWVSASGRMTENHIGLDNPGARAAAQFLHDRPRPACFGISLAADPRDTSLSTARHGISESIAVFQRQKVKPDWYTLNLSCPAYADKYRPFEQRSLIAAAAEWLRGTDVPLWVKIAPNQSAVYYDQIVGFCVEQGVKAIIATNTLGGKGGDSLRLYAQQGYAALRQSIARQGVKGIDLVACGGILTGDDWCAYQEQGARAFQYHSAVYHRGLLAAALILKEAKHGGA